MRHDVSFFCIFLHIHGTVTSYFITPSLYRQKVGQGRRSALIRFNTEQADAPDTDVVERPIEICTLNLKAADGTVTEDTYEIDACEILELDELPDYARAEITGESRVLFRVPENDMEFFLEKEFVTLSELVQCSNEHGFLVDSDLVGHVEGIGELNVEGVVATKKQKFHIHFGAGRLGLGLVVPAIYASGIPFAVLQRPKPKWAEIFSEGPGYVDIKVNDRIVAPGLARVSTSGKEIPYTEYPPRSLVCCGSLEDPIALDLLARATSMSCSLGAAMGKVLSPLKELLPELEPDEQPVLYACENDHNAVMRLKKELEGTVAVVDCMVDRICTGREINADSIRIDAEPWTGSIVAQDPTVTESRRLPFSKSVATAPSSELEAEYYSERKFSLVNGMHTVIAFMTLARQYDNQVLQEYILLKYKFMTISQQREVRAWITARVAELVEKYGMDNLKKWHGFEDDGEVYDYLLEWGLFVQNERFSRTDDVVSRVLGGGVANRWLTRLRPTQAWLEKRFESREAAAENGGISDGSFDNDVVAAAFRHAGFHPTDVYIAEETVRDICGDLVRQGRKFCTRGIEITNKELIEQQRKLGGKSNSPLVAKALAEAHDQEYSSRLSIRKEAQMDRPVAVLFNFDGTLGDTELVAMKVLYWELAPFFSECSDKDCDDFVRLVYDDLGTSRERERAFTNMCQACDKHREARNLEPISKAFTTIAGKLPTKRRRYINNARRSLGLPALEVANQRYNSLEQMQRSETMIAVIAKAVPTCHCNDMLESLKTMDVTCAIATATNYRDRHVSIDAAGLRRYFSYRSVHSPPTDGASKDSAYMQAVQWSEAQPLDCIALESSVEGVISALGSGVALVLGYVGASHVPIECRETHAQKLMQLEGETPDCDNIPGAAMVIDDLRDMPAITAYFANSNSRLEASNRGEIYDPAAIVSELASICEGTVYLPY